MSQADELEKLGLAPAADAVLTAGEEARLLEALSAALRPAALSSELNERLIALALEDPLAPPSEEELAESARLREALERGALHEDAELLGALRAPFEPEPAAATLERALAAALAAAPAPAPRSPAEQRGRVLYAAFGAAGVVLAAAAVIALWLGPLRQSEPQATLTLVKPHSTAPLFDQHFETRSTTARMDAIASARERDLRDNRYAAWGVQ